MICKIAEITGLYIGKLFPPTNNLQDSRNYRSLYPQALSGGINADLQNSRNYRSLYQKILEKNRAYICNIAEITGLYTEYATIACIICTIAEIIGLYT